MRYALDPSRPVLLLDTDGVCARAGLEGGAGSAAGSTAGAARVNDVEVSLAHCLVRALACAGFPLRDVGVISPFRAQLGALRAALAAYTTSEHQLEVRTMFSHFLF